MHLDVGVIYLGKGKRGKEKKRKIGKEENRNREKTEKRENRRCT